MSLLSSPYFPVSVSLSSNTGLLRSALYCGVEMEAVVRIYGNGTVASTNSVSIWSTFRDKNLLEDFGDAVKYPLAKNDIRTRPYSPSARVVAALDQVDIQSFVPLGVFS